MLFDPVDRRALDDQALLEPCKAVVDTSPTRGDEVDQQREIIYACVALGQQIAFEPLESPDGLIHQPADFGEVPRNGQDLLTQPVVHSVLDLARDRRLELGGSLGEGLDLRACSLQRSLQRSRLGTALGRVPQPFLRSLDCAFVHRAQR